MPRVRLPREPQQSLEVGALAGPRTASAGSYVAQGEEALGRAYQKTLATAGEVTDQILKVKAQNVASFEQSSEDGYMARVQEFERQSKLQGVDGYTERLQKFLTEEDRRVRKKLGPNPFAKEVIGRFDRDRSTRLAQAKVWENKETLEQSRMILSTEMERGLGYLSTVGDSYEKYVQQLQSVQGGISERVGLSVSPNQAQKMAKDFEYAGAFASGKRMSSNAGSLLKVPWASVERGLKPYLKHFDNARDKEKFMSDAMSTFQQARKKAEKEISTARGKSLDDTVNKMGRSLVGYFNSPRLNPQQKLSHLNNFTDLINGLIEEYPVKASALKSQRDQFVMQTIFPPLQEMLMQQNDSQALAYMGKMIETSFKGTSLNEGFNKYRREIEETTVSDIFANDRGSKAAVYTKYYTENAPNARSKSARQDKERLEDIKTFLGNAYPTNMAYVLKGLRKESGGSLNQFKKLKPYKELESIDPNFFNRSGFRMFNRPENKELKNEFLEKIQDPQMLMEEMIRIQRKYKNPPPDVAIILKTLQAYNSEREVRSIAIGIVLNNPEVQSYLRMREGDKDGR